MRVRKKLRRPGYDYATPGAYFITICVRHRRPVLGYLKDGYLHLTPAGHIVARQWHWLFVQYPYLRGDAYVVMPDHFHGILWITSGGQDRAVQRRIKPIPELIGAFKTTSSKQIRQAHCSDFRWKKSYYDRIVFDANALPRIRRYIRMNPEWLRQATMAPFQSP